MGSENIERRPNVLLVSEAPSGWSRSIWREARARTSQEFDFPAGRVRCGPIIGSEQINSATPRDDTQDGLPFIQEYELIESLDDLQKRQRQQWLESVGRTPEDTNIIFVVPVHNEKRNLESFFGALLVSDMPVDVDATWIVGVNNSTDDSFDEASKRLRIFTQSESKKFNLDDEIFEQLEDDGLEKEALVFKKGNQRFILMNTSSPSKGNVMNIANRYAIRQGHDLVVNFDSNNYGEPDTIRTLVAAGYEHVVNGELFFVDATPVSEKRIGDRSVLEKFINRYITGQEGPIVSNNRRDNDISGWGMAWSPQKLESIGGVPPKGGDDYPLGVLARVIHQRERVNFHSPAVIWGNTPSIIDRVKGAGRWYRERRQLIDYVDENMPQHSTRVREILRDERDMGVGLGERVLRSINKVRSNPKGAGKEIMRFVKSQIGELYGRYLYHKDPDATTWEPLESTK